MATPSTNNKANTIHVDMDINNDNFIISELEIVKMSSDDVMKDEQLMKQMKQLCRKATGERFRIFGGHEVIVCKLKSNKKLAGLCCISMRSPEAHFPNEKNINNSNKEVPYLYNYMRDIKHIKYEPALAIMLYIKQYIRGKLYTEINLDVAQGNNRARRFFERNGFKYMGEYIQTSTKYDMFTYNL
jgi:hypothetical protein